MARLCLILAVLLLAGCAAPEPFIAGPAVAPPSGWIDYCARHPGDPSC